MMKFVYYISAVLLFVAYFGHAARIDTRQKHETKGVFGSIVKGLGNIAQSVVTPQQPQIHPYGPATSGGAGSPPPPPPRAELEAQERVLNAENSINNVLKTSKELADTYKQIDQDVQVPLDMQAAALKAEKARITEKLTALTKKIRYAYDKAHPDKKNLPLVIVTKNADDDMRKEANDIDHSGSMDLLKGITSPCANFHKVRESEEHALEEPEDDTKFKTESKTLNKMTPAERIKYDEAMIKEYADATEQAENSIKAAAKEPEILSSGGESSGPGGFLSKLPGVGGFLSKLPGVGGPGAGGVPAMAP